MPVRTFFGALLVHTFQWHNTFRRSHAEKGQPGSHRQTYTLVPVVCTKDVSPTTAVENIPSERRHPRLSISTVKAGAGRGCMNARFCVPADGEESGLRATTL